MEAHEIHMDAYAAKYTDPKSTSPVISDERYNAIIHHIQHPEVKIDHNLKHYITKRGYQLLQLHGHGEDLVLVVPNKSKKVLFLIYTTYH